MEVNKYNFYLTTTRGTIINTNCDPKGKILHEKAENASEVTSLITGRNENELLIGHSNGNLSVFDLTQFKYTKTVKDLEGEGPVVGLGLHGKVVIAGRKDGIVNLWNKSNDFFSLDLDEKGTLDCLVSHPVRECIGTGGEHNDFKLWDLETRQTIFKAKSLGHDELNLPIPTSIRGICYLPDDEHLTCCATKEGHVLLYDERAQRRPIQKFKEPKASFTCISPAYRERQCLVGTTRGYLILIDMKAGKTLRTFQSFTGSVTSIACDPVDPIVATTSLDRHLRIHNLDTKQLLYKSYLKQSLTRLIMKPVVKDEENEAVEQAEPKDAEYEELFDNMETITDQPKRKKSLGKLQKAKKAKKSIEP